MDLEHGIYFLRRTSIDFGIDLSLCKDADIIVACAGHAQRPKGNQARFGDKKCSIDQGDNSKIYNLQQRCHMSWLQTRGYYAYFALKYSGFSWKKIFGTGTLLDTIRFRRWIGEKFVVHPKAIHAYILGEHGDSAFPATTAATIGGMKTSNCGRTTRVLKIILNCFGV